MKELKKKHSVWLSESAWSNVEHHYQADNCSTKNEYIEKAIQFYSGYLDTEHARNICLVSSLMCWKASWVPSENAWGICSSSRQWTRI